MHGAFFGSEQNKPPAQICVCGMSWGFIGHNIVSIGLTDEAIV